MLPTGRRSRTHGRPGNQNQVGRSTTEPAHAPETARARRALTERVAGWSIRHRGLAIGGWLALVVVAVLSTALVSGPSAVTEDPGESGSVKKVLNSQKKYEPLLENVLIQQKGPGGAEFVENPELREATEDLVAEFRKTPGMVSGLRTPLSRELANLAKTFTRKYWGCRGDSSVPDSRLCRRPPPRISSCHHLLTDTCSTG